MRSLQKSPVNLSSAGLKLALLSGEMGLFPAGMLRGALGVLESRWTSSAMMVDKWTVELDGSTDVCRKVDLQAGRGPGTTTSTQLEPRQVAVRVLDLVLSRHPSFHYTAYSWTRNGRRGDAFAG